MKVKELIKELQKLDQEAEVLMQKDSEGNGYRNISGVEQDEAVELAYEEYDF